VLITKLILNSISARILVSIISVAGILLLGGCNSTEDTGPTPVLSGAPATALPMPPPSGYSVGTLGWTILQTAENSRTRANISDFKGNVLVLDMYATWCVPCRESIPHLIQLQTRYAARCLEIVGLNVGGPDDRVKVKDFARELRINYPLGFPDRALTDVLMFDDVSIPQTFVFNREGFLVKRIIGYRADELDQVIDQELARSLSNTSHP